jgi:hypothetical protein
VDGATSTSARNTNWDIRPRRCGESAQSCRSQPEAGLSPQCNAQYSGDLNWTYTLDPTWSLAGTVSANALSAYDAAGIAQSYFAWIPSIVLSASLPQSSSLFAEYTYYSRVGPNVQVDVEYGVSPTLLDAQTQHYVGAGLSFLY